MRGHAMRHCAAALVLQLLLGCGSTSDGRPSTDYATPFLGSWSGTEDLEVGPFVSSTRITVTVQRVGTNRFKITPSVCGAAAFDLIPPGSDGPTATAYATEFAFNQPFACVSNLSDGGCCSYGLHDGGGHLDGGVLTFWETGSADDISCGGTAYGDYARGFHGTANEP
jgi:hypothetical protein